MGNWLWIGLGETALFDDEVEFFIPSHLEPYLSPFHEFVQEPGCSFLRYMDQFCDLIPVQSWYDCEHIH